jgi:hypothetical protein
MTSASAKAMAMAMASVCPDSPNSRDWTSSVVRVPGGSVSAAAWSMKASASPRV